MISYKKKSQKQEDRVAKEIGGRRVIASGALWGSKGDVRNSDYLIECKTTSKSFYTLNRQVWDKIYKEAVRDGARIPVMCIELKDGKTKLAVLSTVFSNNGETFNIASKSFRVSKPCNVVFCTPTKTAVKIIPWEDFLDQIQEV